MRMNDRRVATFIQDMLHLKPHEEHELERPLAFLLPRSEGLPLSPSGRELNNALQGYKRDLLNKLKHQIAFREQQIDRFHGKAIQVVVSDSGTGKTLLLARTIALLLDLRATEDDEYQVPEIGFSQLKSYKDHGVKTAICSTLCSHQRTFQVRLATSMAFDRTWAWILSSWRATCRT